MDNKIKVFNFTNKVRVIIDILMKIIFYLSKGIYIYIITVLIPKIENFLNCLKLSI